MCGIAGCFGSFPAERLGQAGAAIAHRGPDGSGTFTSEDGVSLHHGRLAIIDLSPLGAQPMKSHDGSLVITFNGEIYNYRELRDELSRAGMSFRSQSDTEVLLQLYRAEGDAMLGRLNGIFAFALWDQRDKSLLLVRDQLGVKPLYYSQTSRGFAFASEIKALLHLVPEVRELDPEALNRYLTFLWCPGDATPLRDVRKLGPGEAMRVRGGKIERRWTWYRLPFFEPPGAQLGETDAVQGTADALRRAVHRQLVADVPVGAFLSGGLDSSSVVAFARERSPDIRCFTIEAQGDQDGFADDLPYARRVARHLGVSLDVITIDAGRMAHDLEAMVWQLDEPLGDPAPLNVLYISQLARRHGMKVLLSGGGGDDVFSGYRRHVALAYEPYWRWLPRPLRVALDSVASALNQRRTLGRRLGRMFSGAALDGDARIAHAFRWIRDRELFELYAPALRAQVGATSAEAPLLDFLGMLPGETAPLNRMLALEQRFYLADHNLIYTDKMAMAAGVEVRVPFLDPELVAFAARIPPGLKQHGNESKWVLKKAMEPFLPAEVIYRPKSGFGAPLRRWMRNDLRGLLGDLLSPESLARRGIFDAGTVSRLIQRNDAGQVDAAYTLLSILTIEIWCRKFLDAPPAAGLAAPGLATAALR